MTEKRVFAGLVAGMLFLSCLLLSACQTKRAPMLYQTTFWDVFDTVTSVKLYAADEQEFQERVQWVHGRLVYFTQLYDIYTAYDGVVNLKTVNEQAGDRPVAVEDAVLDLLEYGKSVYTTTEGRVNMAYGSVLSLWHQCRETALNGGEARLPDAQALEDAARHTDIDDVVIDRKIGTVYFRDAELKLDVGAIAKGYAVEQICREMAEKGWVGMLSVGGNVQTVKQKADGTPWRVGVEHPDGDGLAAVMEIGESAVVTSGDYQRYYEVDGVRYAHIIDPATQYPARYMRSVTVLAPSSALADALSTGLFLMSPEDGKRFVETLEDVEAFWILSDGTTQQSDGMAGHLTEGTI